MAVPAAPSGLSVSAITSQSATFTWADASNDETSFFVQRRLLLGGVWQTWETVTVASGSTSHAQTGLRPASRYQARIQAVNASGTSGDSNVVEFVTLGLFAKGWVNASAAGETGITVQVWRAPASGLGAGEPLHIIEGEAFSSDLETGPTSGQPEAVMLVAIPAPATLPVLHDGDPVRMYAVGYVGGVETFTRIMRDAVIRELVVDVDGGPQPPVTGNDPVISGPGTIGQPHQYTAGTRAPISGSWWNVDGMRVYPTDRDYVGTDMDVGHQLQAEDVVNGVSYFSSPITMTSPTTVASEEIGEFKANGVEAVANAIGTAPAPNPGDSLVWRGENLRRLAGGGLALITNGSYIPGQATIELQSANSVNHEFKFSAIGANAFWFEAQFDGTNGEYSLYTGATNNAGGLAVRVSRGDNVSQWRAQVIKYVGHGTSPTTESQIGSDQSLPAAMSSMTITITRTRATGAALIVITPNSGTPVTFSFSDSSAGRWICGKILGNGGSGSPTMEIRGGVGNGAGAAAVPVNDRFVTVYYRDFRVDQRRSAIAAAVGAGVEFIDHQRWDPTVINDEAQVFVTGDNYRGHYESPSPTKIGGDPFAWTPAGLQIRATEAPLAERPFLNPVPIWTYSTHADRIALSGFTPSVAQREAYRRVRVASDNSYWYMHPPSSPKAGQWRECGSRWYSGCLEHRGIKAFKYVALRLRITGSIGPGIWFCGWWLPDSKVESCEIDVIETASTSAADRGGWHGNTHEPDPEVMAYSSAATQQRSGIKQFPAGGNITKEHCIECNWEYERIRWYLDGRLVHTARNVSYEEMTFIMDLAIANGNDGFQERFDASTPNPTTFTIHSLHMAQRPSHYAHGPIKLSRPVIRDNGNGSAVVTAAAVVSGSVSSTKYWRRYLWPQANSSGTYWYSSADERTIVSYVEEHTDANGRKTVVSSTPLYIQNGVGTEVAGAVAPNSGPPGEPGTGSYTDFDFTLGVEPPGATASNPERFVKSSSYEPGVVTTAPVVGFGSGWSTLGTAPSLTQNAGVSPDGTKTATRMVVAAGLSDSGIRYAIGGRTPGVHTTQVWVRSNTGSAQQFQSRSLVTGVYQTLTATTEWQRFTSLGTLSSDWFSLDIASAGSANDLLVWGMDFFVGDATTSSGVGGRSYLDLQPGHSVTMDVTPGEYDLVLTKSDGTTTTTLGHTLSSDTDYSLDVAPQQLSRARFYAAGANVIPAASRPAGFVAGDNIAAPPGITDAHPATASTAVKWGSIVQGTCVGTNDQWNVTNWGLDGAITQVVYVGPQTTQYTNSLRFTGSVPRNWPWPGPGSANSEVKSYPNGGWGQFPGDANKGHPNLPVKIGDINVIWTGYKSLSDSGTSLHGHLAHDAWIMDSPAVFDDWAAAEPHIVMEVMVVIKQYESYGSVLLRDKNRYHGQYTIGGHDWHVFIQVGGATGAGGLPVPMLVFVPATFPGPNPANHDALYRWARTTKHADLILNAPGLMAYGRGPQDTILNPNHYLVCNKIGMEIDEGVWDDTVGSAYYRVNMDAYTPAS